MCAIHPWMHGSDRSAGSDPGTELEHGWSSSIRRAWGAELSSAPWAAGRLATALPLGVRPAALLLGGRQPAARRGAALPGAAADPGGAQRLATDDPDPRGRGPVLPAADADVDLRRDFPGPDDPPARGPATEVTFRHQLPPSAGELTVHLHGGHNRTAVRRPARRADRVPRRAPSTATSRAASRRGESGNDLLIEPGGQRTYVYDLRRTAGPNGPPSSGTTTTASSARPATSGTAWPGCGSSTTSSTPRLPLPRGERDVPLMIADRSFDRHNQLTDPFTDPRPPARRDQRPPDPRQRRLHAATTGSRAQRYRLRILNVSQFRSYNLYLSNGAPMVQIGTDSGLMPKPVRRERDHARAGRAGRGGGRLRARGGGERSSCAAARATAPANPLGARPTSAR